MTRGAVVSALIAAALAASSCSGSSAELRSSRAASEPAANANTPAALTAAARAAVVGHHRLSVQVLWTNRVPPQQQWVAGPALRALVSAARDRSRRSIRVRLVRESFRILSLRLDQSYAKASAVVVDQQTAAVYEHGRRTRRAVQLGERARVEPRRPGKAPRFVVWRVRLLR